MRGELFAAAIGVAVLIGPAALARPCRLDANDKPIDCPPAAPTQPPAKGATAPIAPAGLKACTDPKSGKAIKCPPRMLTPQRMTPDQ